MFFGRKQVHILLVFLTGSYLLPIAYQLVEEWNKGVYYDKKMSVEKEVKTQLFRGYHISAIRVRNLFLPFFLFYFHIIVGSHLFLDFYHDISFFLGGRSKKLVYYRSHRIGGTFLSWYIGICMYDSWDTFGMCRKFFLVPIDRYLVVELYLNEIQSMKRTRYLVMFTESVVYHFP